MDIAEKIRNFLAKLQALPEQKKKIILWSIVAVLGIIMGFFWIRGAMDSLSKIGISGMPTMPSLDILQTTTPSNK